MLVPVATVVLVGCRPSAAHPAPATTQTVTSTETLPAPPSHDPFVPAAAHTVAPLPPGTQRSGERDQQCPYLKTGLQHDPASIDGGKNAANLEGDRIYRTTVLTRYRPVGCRFYFWAPPYEAIADIRPQRLASAAAAYDAMIRIAATGTEEETDRNFAGSLVGISFRTKYFGPDHGRDWAFVFATGATVVTVYTQRSDTSRPALYLGAAVAARF